MATIVAILIFNCVRDPLSACGLLGQFCEAKPVHSWRAAKHCVRKTWEEVYSLGSGAQSMAMQKLLVQGFGEKEPARFQLLENFRKVRDQAHRVRALQYAKSPRKREILVPNGD